MAATEDRVEQVFIYIIDYCRKSSGVPPTVREIQRQLNISSTSMVAFYLDKLAADGRIERKSDTARGISVPGAIWVYPAEVDQEGVYWSVVDSEPYVDDWSRTFYPAADLPERMRP